MPLNIGCCLLCRTYLQQQKDCMRDAFRSFALRVPEAGLMTTLVVVSPLESFQSGDASNRVRRDWAKSSGLIDQTRTTARDYEANEETVKSMIL